jgi:hypothetical protein
LELICITIVGSVGNCTIRENNDSNVYRKYANLTKRGRGSSYAPLLRLQRGKRLAIAYHNRNRNRNCGGEAKCGVTKISEQWEL